MMLLKLLKFVNNEENLGFVKTCNKGMKQMPFEFEKTKIVAQTDNIYSFNKDKKDNKVAIFAMYSDIGEINETKSKYNNTCI